METHQTEGLVFLSDLNGFARLVREMTLEALAEAAKQFAEISYRHVRQAGGTLVKYLGDSALGYFPAERVDEGVQALMAMKREIETEYIVGGKNIGIRIGAHYGPFAVCTLPPFETEDILGETVNIAAVLGSGGQSKHRDRLILSPETFRKLDATTRKSFHKYTEPIVYLADK